MPEAVTETTPAIAPDPEPQPEPDPEAQPEPDVEAEAAPEAEVLPEPEAEVQPEPEAEAEALPEPEPDAESAPSAPSPLQPPPEPEIDPLERVVSLILGGSAPLPAEIARAEQIDPGADPLAALREGLARFAPTALTPIERMRLLAAHDRLLVLRHRLGQPPRLPRR